MSVRAHDERAHSPDATAGWWEAWHLDVATEDGVGLAVRLACAPALGVAWWWTHLLLPDSPGPIVVRDHEVGLPRQGLEIRADGLWAELTCETPFEHWTYGLEAFGVKLDDPADSLHGEVGERMPVGLDIEWEVEPHSPVPREFGGSVHGYEQFGVVHGEVLLERSRFELDAVARRSHWWGSPRIDRSVRSAWIRSPDLSMSFAASDDRVDGYFKRADQIAQSVSTVRTETRRRADGLPLGARHVVNDRFVIDAEVLQIAAVPLLDPDGQRAALCRGLCRYEVADPDDTAPEGRAVIGWSSWLDPE